MSWATNHNNDPDESDKAKELREELGISRHDEHYVAPDLTVYTSASEAVDAALSYESRSNTGVNCPQDSANVAD